MGTAEISLAPKFRDGIRQIDMVLCYKVDKSKVDYKRSCEKRRIFERNLEEVEGFHLERDEESETAINYVRIHMPPNVEMRLMNGLQIDYPIKELKPKPEDELNKNKKIYGKIMQNKLNFMKYDESKVTNEISFYETLSGRRPEEQLIEKERFSSLNNAQRNFIVNQILLKTEFDTEETKCDTDKKYADKVGIQNLVNDGVYDSWFPLHEELQNEYHYNNSSEINTDRTVSLLI